MRWDNNYYTLRYVGLEGYPQILVPSAPPGCKRYTTIGVIGSYLDVEKLLTHEISRFAIEDTSTKMEKKRVVGIAYMMDHSILLVYNEVGRKSMRFYGKEYGPHDFISYRKNGKKISENLIAHVAKIVKEINPIGVALLQEIPSPEEGLFHFRIIHESQSDAVLAKVINFPARKIRS